MIPGSDEIAACMAMALNAVVDRDISRQRIVDAFLSLDRDDRAPARHRGCPFDGMGPDIGAAVDRHNAISMNAPPRFKQLQRQLDVHRARGARSSN